jgi:hypothetical protein
VKSLIETVGRRRFDAACEWAWETAKGCGSVYQPEMTASHEPDDPASVPHELAEALWFGPRDDLGERLHLALDLYALMPSYVHLMYIRNVLAQLDRADRGMLWDAYRGWLDRDDDRLADPVAYSLVKDYFPHAQLVFEVWPALTALERPRVRRLKRLLPISGPVPYQLKAELYETLMVDTRWHPLILASLLHSRTSSNGHIDLPAARDLLAGLHLTDASIDLEPTRRLLIER